MLYSAVAMCCFVAVQAMSLPFLDDVVGPGLGGFGGINHGIGGMGGMEHSNSGFGHRGSLGSSSGYGSHGYGSEGGSSSHDIGHTSHDFKQITESHVSEGHDLGHSSGFSSHGHDAGAYNDYGAHNEGFGHNNYGSYYGGF